MKRDNLAIERSIIQIQKWIIDELSMAEIKIKCIEKKYCTTDRHAENLIKRARERWSGAQSQTIAEKRDDKVRQLTALKRKLAVKWRGHPAGLNAITRIDNLIVKIEGMALPVKVQLTGADDGPIQIKTDDGIDYDKLPTEVLRALADARTKSN